MKIKELFEDTETSVQDFIITAFEQDEISFEEALRRIQEVSSKDEMYFWEMELHAAKGMKEERQRAAH